MRVGKETLVWPNRGRLPRKVDTLYMTIHTNQPHCRHSKFRPLLHNTVVNVSHAAGAEEDLVKLIQNL